MELVEGEGWAEVSADESRREEEGGGGVGSKRKMTMERVG